MPSRAERAPRQRPLRRRVLVVARREFVATVTRKGYLITLVAMPALLAGLAILPSLGVALSGGEDKLLGIKGPDELTVVGVVDLAEPPVIGASHVDWHNDDQAEARLEGRQLPEWLVSDSELPAFLSGGAEAAARDRGGLDSNRLVELRLFAGIEAGEAATEAGDVDELFVLEEDYRLTSRVRVVIAENRPLNPGAYSGRVAVARLIRRSLAAPFVDDPVVLARLLRVMETTEEVLGEGGSGTEGDSGVDKALQALLPVLFAMFFSMTIFVASGYLLDGIGEEKENRVLEVLLASLTPEELLLGKMVGLGGAGLLQSLFFAVVGLVPMLLLGSFSVGLPTVAGMLVCIMLGFVMYASMMGASGAVAGNRHEGRQISAFWTMFAIIPVFLLPAFMAGGDAPIAVVLSLFPPTAPIAMMLRLGAGGVPAWQLAVSIGGMAVTAWLAWRVGSRVFRVGILMTGARPSIRQVWGWVRQG